MEKDRLDALEERVRILENKQRKAEIREMEQAIYWFGGKPDDFFSEFENGETKDDYIKRCTQQKEDLEAALEANQKPHEQEQATLPL